MCPLTKLESILNPKYKHNDSSKLTETGGIMEISVVCDNEYKDKYSIYKFANGGSEIFPYFQSGHNLRQMCDYFVFVLHKDQLYTFAIELKKGKGSPTTQLVNSKRFIKYILDCCNSIHGNPIDINNIRTIKISDRAILNNRRKQRSNKKEKILKNKISPPKIYFDKDGHMNYDLCSALHLNKIIEAIFA